MLFKFSGTVIENPPGTRTEEIFNAESYIHPPGDAVKRTLRLLLFFASEAVSKVHGECSRRDYVCAPEDGLDIVYSLLVKGVEQVGLDEQGDAALGQVGAH